VSIELDTREPPSALYRADAVAHQASRAFGEILDAKPISTMVIAWFRNAATFVAYLFLWVYTNKARVSGYLAPSKGFVRVQSPLPWSTRSFA
jgi:hypothetical protein